MTTIAPIIEALDERVSRMASACTQCGKCVEVCPMPNMVDLEVSDAPGLMGGVLGLLSKGAPAPAAEQWAAVCSGTGHCIEACPEGLNPRFLLAMARRMTAKRSAIDERRADGRAQFQRMSRGVKVLSRLQLPPDLLERLSPSSHPERDVPPDLIFYTGCNLLKTPHIGLLALDILDRLGVSYEVYGGPSSCCGIMPMRPGDDENAMRQGTRTLQRFAQTQTSEVLSWCPTCQLQFGEITLPVQVGVTTPSFDMTMFPVYLARRLNELKVHLSTPVNKRVALHEHPGTPGVVPAVHQLLDAIPGLELVALDVPKVGYALTALAPTGDALKGLLATELSAAANIGVDTLVGVYHTEHRELAGHESQWSFDVANYLELIAESMGIFREDVFKRLKTMQDVDAILSESAELIRVNGLDPEQTREVVMADLLSDQILPLDRSEHEPYLAS